MGSCYSVHGGGSNANSAEMKLKLSFGSKTEKVVAPSPPPPTTKNGTFFGWSPSRSTTTFTDQGSKDEAFFDSKAWLDSDCEDDFYSVNGDFTPSRGTTPVHNAFGTPIVNNTPSVNRIFDSATKPSPEKKKRLSDLFRDSVKVDQDDDDGNGKKDARTTIQDVLPKSAHGTPYISGANSACSSERIMGEDGGSVREKSAKSLQRCLPSLSSCRSFSERRRKASPAIAVNGKH